VTILVVSTFLLREGFDECTSTRSEVYYARRRGDSGYRGGGVGVCKNAGVRL
jgi:hypothetical protein